MKEVQSKEFKPIEPASLASRLSQLVQQSASAGLSPNPEQRQGKR